MSAVKVEMTRSRNIRIHSTWTADVPEEMLSDPTYFDDNGYPTPDFDQWMCDNGTEADADGPSPDNDDLDYEVATIDGEDAKDYFDRLGKVRCPVCREYVEEDEMNHWPKLAQPVSMCDSCEHDARRSGWEPGRMGAGAMSTRKDGRPRSVAITLPLDPMPYVWSGTKLRTGIRFHGEAVDFDPRPGYSQRIEDYA